MRNPDIPVAVKAFINDHIDSVMQLELLLLLHRTAPKEWSADAIGRELQLDPALVASELANLCAQGLLVVRDETAPVYQYSPRTAAIERGVSGLAKTYATRHVAVISLIYSKQIRIFADAFRLRRDRDRE